MSIRNHLKDLAVSDNGFVFDPYSGFTYTVNPTGLSILRGLKDGASQAEIADSLRDQFELTSQVDLERDVEEFIGVMRTQGLLPREGEP